jgi:hypothetical protein
MRSGVAWNKTPWAAAATDTIPLYKIRGLLRHGIEHLTEKQWAKISNCLDIDDPVRSPLCDYSRTTALSEERGGSRAAPSEPSTWTATG